MGGGPEGEDPFLGPRCLLVTPRSADRGIEAVQVQRLLQGFGLHDVGVNGSTMGDRADAPADPVTIDVDEQLEAELGHAPVAEGNHLLELPQRVHVQQSNGRLGREEGLHGEMQQDGRVLADRVQDDGLAKSRGSFPQDMDALSFERLQVGIRGWHESLSFRNGNYSTAICCACGGKSSKSLLVFFLGHMRRFVYGRADSAIPCSASLFVNLLLGCRHQSRPVVKGPGCRFRHSGRDEAYSGLQRNASQVPCRCLSGTLVQRRHRSGEEFQCRSARSFSVKVQTAR